jgi:hypothetical protein
VISTRLYNPKRVSSVLLVSPTEVIVSGRQLEVGVKVDIKIGERVIIKDTKTLVIYN